MSLLKYWRILILIAFLIVSIALISPWKKSGVVVVHIDPNLSDVLKPGDIIYEINGEEARKDLLRGMVRLKTSRGEFETFINDSVVVEERPFTNLRFGLDIKGGILAIVKPEENVSSETLEDIKMTLERRMSSLRESSFQIIRYGDEKFIQIQIAGGTEDELKMLINTTGVFDARIPLPVVFENGKGKLKFGDESEWLDVELKDNATLMINGRSFSINETFVHNGINFTIWEINNSKASIAAIVYKNSGERRDIVRVYTDPRHSYIQKTDNWYSWQFDVEVSPSAAETFFKAVKNLGISYEGGRSYLESKIYLYLDDKEVSNLSIGASLKNRPTTTATVSGSALTRDDALKEKQWLQLILRSGALPTNLDIVSIKAISPKLGEAFLKYVLMALIFAIITVSAIMLIRYKNPKISLPAILTSLSEVVIILGASVLINWTLDLASIAGIIVIVGTGVDQQIMIIDETLSGESEWSLKAKIKRAFFMIFVSAGTTLCAMLPLMLIGFGLLRGFAVTTSLGILIAVFITRPAFADIIGRLLR